MDEWKIYFGSFTDLTYDLISDDKELDPIPSPIPESVLNLTKLITDYNINQDQIVLKKKKAVKDAAKQLKNSDNRISSSSQQLTKESSMIIDDNDLSSSSSSSADFEIEAFQKHKKNKKIPKVTINRVVYSFSKPEPEVRRMFVTSRAPRSKNNEKKVIARGYSHLAPKLTSRRKVPVSSMVHQHELMLVDISDLEKKSSIRNYEQNSK